MGSLLETYMEIWICHITFLAEEFLGYSPVSFVGKFMDLLFATVVGPVYGGMKKAASREKSARIGLSRQKLRIGRLFAVSVFTTALYTSGLYRGL